MAVVGQPLRDDGEAGRGALSREMFGPDVAASVTTG
jgi:hypothetical protein